MGDAQEAAAFEAFVWARGSALLRYAVLISDDLMQAEDVTQECLIRLATHWKRANRDNVDAYARRILSNLVIDQSRRRAARTRMQAQLERHDLAQHGQEQDVVNRLAVRQALLELPARQRVIVVMRYWGGSTELETADALNCSVGNVKSQGHLAMKRLRSLLSTSVRETQGG